MDIPHEILSRILKAAVQAPSADNSQPWSFNVTGNIILINNTGDVVESIFNYHQIVNHVGLGACIQNIIISAEDLGYRTQISLFPNSSDERIVARIELTEDESIKNDLAQYIEKRSTNRKKYHNKEIPMNILTTLGAVAEDLGGRISFISNRSSVGTAAHAVSAGEELALTSKPIHDYLFSHITWTKKDDAIRHGFYIDTFEFVGPQKSAFKLFRNWNILRMFLPFGIAKFIAKDMEAVYASSAAFGSILMPNMDKEQCVKAGMIFQRFSLMATKLGISFQPTTGANFFAIPILDGNSFGLSKYLVDLLKTRQSLLCELFGTNRQEEILMVFRLGYADSPTSRTTRFNPLVTFS